jgi:hypothetical protein
MMCRIQVPISRYLPVLWQITAKDLDHVLLESGMHRSCRVDLTYRQMGRSLFRDQDVDSVVLLLPDDNDKSEEEFVVWSYGR